MLWFYVSYFLFLSYLSLKSSLKSKLMSASARALKVCMYYPDPMMSFERIHTVNKRVTPNPMMNYNLGIQLYKLYNTREHSLEWLQLDQNQILTSWQTHFQILRSNSLRIGLNALADRIAYWHCLERELIKKGWLKYTRCFVRTRHKQAMICTAWSSHTTLLWVTVSTI